MHDWVERDYWPEHDPKPRVIVEKGQMWFRGDDGGRLFQVPCPKVTTKALGAALWEMIVLADSLGVDIRPLVQGGR